MTTQETPAAPSTRCKFRCNSVKSFGGGSVEIELGAIYPSESDGYAHGENHAFFNATPSGKLVMTINNPYGAELFQAGDDFYLDISKVPKPAAA